MNIYWCHELDEPYGLYVAAPTRGRAKKWFAMEVDCAYTDVRTTTMRRGVTDTFEGSIAEGDPILEKYGLEYLDEEYTEEYL